jgi:hypothetical protein
MEKLEIVLSGDDRISFFRLGWVKIRNVLFRELSSVVRIWFCDHPFGVSIIGIY